ncbi:MAG TPA: hypothetical protein VIF62_04145 [Labilithrix sp.]
MLRAVTMPPRLRLALVLAPLLACHHGGSGDDATLPSDDTKPADSSTPPGGDPAGAPPAPGARPTVADDADAVTIRNETITIRWDKHTGAADFSFGGFTAVKAAYASVDLGPPLGYVTTKGYATHALGSSKPIDDAEGAGLEVVLVSSSPGRPDIQQIVTIHAGSKSFLLDEHVVGTALASAYLGALIVDDTGDVEPGPGADPRVLDVPFDNDDWVRYDSRVLGANDFSGTGYEVAAVYESTSRRGLVVGSVTHDFWKTGIYYDATKGRLRKMNVYGGAATPDQPSHSGATYGSDGTHDVAKHGAMTGMTLASPTIFVGYFDDWRDGMEAYGRANARIAPPRTWAGGAPFGWMSWGAYGSGVTADRLTGVSDFLKTNLASGPFGAGGPVYVNIDAGLNTDAAPVVAHVHANGQRAGTYRVPFAYYAAQDPTSLAKPVGSFTLADVVLRDDAGNPIWRKGAYVLDVTHPGARALMKSEMDSVVAGGFDWLKLDFMTFGVLEGKHYDPTVKTGVQAYNQAMQYLTSLLPPNIFVSLSIAPLFPSGYAHARRISCDVIGQLDDVQAPAYPHYGSTEYMLNSLTFGWWQAGTLYPFVDPDAMALYKFGAQGKIITPEWAKTRVSASAIAGAPFLDSTDYSDATASQRMTTLLANADVDAMIRNAKGAAFRPIDGGVAYVSAPISGSTDTNSGSAASDVFVRADGGTVLVAAFDFDGQNAATKSIDLARAGLDPNGTYTVTDLWAGTTTSAKGTLSIALAAGESKILRLAPQ